MILRFRNVFLDPGTVCWTQFEHLSRSINLPREAHWLRKSHEPLVYYGNLLNFPSSFLHCSWITKTFINIFFVVKVRSKIRFIDRVKDANRKIWRSCICVSKLETGMPLVWCLLACRRAVSYNILLFIPQIRMYITVELVNKLCYVYAGTQSCAWHEAKYKYAWSKYHSTSLISLNKIHSRSMVAAECVANTDAQIFRKSISGRCEIRLRSGLATRI